ncbi:MAG TPA: carbohydrate ABC transporter permease [Candidatus Limnocylindrales bacterium]
MRPRSRDLPGRLRMVAVSALLLAICVVWVYPLVWMVGASLKSNAEVFADPSPVTAVLHLENYVRAWNEARMGDYFLNTVIVTGGSIVITVTAVAMMGYVLGRYRFPGKPVVIALFAIVIFLPEGYTIIPVVDLINKLGLGGSLWGLTLAESGGAHVVSTLLFAGYFSRLPKELAEAAAIDGAGFLRTFYRVYLPLAKPVVAVAVILQFMHAWNDFLLPLVLTLTRPELRTLSVGMYAFQGEEFTDWSGMMASATIGLLPIVVLFLFLQRYFVEGVAGAVKE